MKKAILTALAAAIILPISAHPGHKHDHTSGGYPITPVPFTSVKVESNSFWGQRLEASRVVTIPLAFSKCESEGRYTNFSNAAEHMKDPSKVFKVNGVGYSFDDTDPYKTIEGASYILQTYPDENAIQKQMQTYRTLEAKAADLDQEKLNEKRMSIRPKKEEEAQKRISNLYGYCQDNFFRASKNAVAKRLGEQPTDIEKQEPNKQTVPTPSWLKGRKKKDDRDER